MLSGQVTAPILRLAQLWQEFQQVGISVERLGDILNTRTELPGSRMTLPPIKGRVSFDKVTFRYRPETAEVLSGIDLDVAPGEVRSEEHTSELQSLMRISYAVFCLKKKTTAEGTTSTLSS